ncbi:hypothetical protein DFH94DRAFT_688278 [Russula ochroleuca]|jgi:hypothetical protein|uniref:Uncharacterized protein n=1 Tax=Russula ochroleuca TaxID=152965 RepID=A0A9P5N494_9AGAM|nr:hypothetical protein DFH94DRAFT_688278 [Russula ochroleuca]
MASATPSWGLHVECENFIVSFIVAIDRIDARTSQIKRRRKRLLPPEPCLDERAPLDFVLPDEGLSDLSPGTREAYPLSGGVLTLDGNTGESSPVLSQICPPSDLPIGPILDHEGQPITVHEFLQDMSASSRAGRKYGRRNRLATVKLDDYHSKDCRGPTPLTPSSCGVESRNDRRISDYPCIQSGSKHPSRRVPHLRRKKRLAKPLAQRLFEADVFSSGTSSRPMSDRGPAHTSSRRPLQFITSLNLIPSLESRIYPKKEKWSHGKAGNASAADPEIWAASQADDPAPAGTSPNGLAVATCRKPWNRNWNGTQTGASAAGKRGFRMRGGRQSAAQVLSPSPFGYVPLPLVRMDTAAARSTDPAELCRPQYCAGRARMVAGVKPISISDLQLPAVCALD